MDRSGYDDSFRNESVDKEILTELDQEFNLHPTSKGSKFNFMLSQSAPDWTQVMRDKQQLNCITAENQRKHNRLEKLRSSLQVLESESIKSQCRYPPSYSHTIQESHTKISNLKSAHSETQEKTEDEKLETYKLLNSKEKLKKAIEIMKERIDQLQSVYKKINAKQHKFQLAKFHASSLYTQAKENKLKVRQETSKLNDYFQSCIFSCLAERKSAKDTLKTFVQRFSLLSRRNQSRQSYRVEMLNKIETEIQQCRKTKELQSLYKDKLVEYNTLFQELEKILNESLGVDISKPASSDLADKILHEFSIVQFTQLSLSSKYEELATKLSFHYKSVRDLSVILNAYRSITSTPETESPKHRTTLNLYQDIIDISHPKQTHQVIERLIIVMLVSSLQLSSKTLNSIYHIKELEVTLPHKLEHFYVTLGETVKHLSPEFHHKQHLITPISAKLPALTSFKHTAANESTVKTYDKHTESDKISQPKFKLFSKKVTELFYSIHPESREKAESFGKLVQGMPCLGYALDIHQIRQYLTYQTSEEAFQNVLMLMNRARKEIHDKVNLMLMGFKSMIICMNECNLDGDQELEAFYKDKLPNRLDHVKDMISDPWLKKKQWRLPEKDLKKPSELYKLLEPSDQISNEDIVNTSRSTQLSQPSYNPNPEKRTLVQTTLQDMLNFEYKLKELKTTERNARDIQLSVSTSILPSLTTRRSFQRSMISSGLPSTSVSKIDTSKLSLSKPMSTDLSKRASTAG